MLLKAASSLSMGVEIDDWASQTRALIQRSAAQGVPCSARFSPSQVRRPRHSGRSAGSSQPGAEDLYQETKWFFIWAAENGNVEVLEHLRRQPEAWRVLSESRTVLRRMEVLAAESGHVNVLKFLMHEGLWSPQRGGAALRAADEAGKKMDLLRHFQMPLAEYPDHAHAYEVVQAFQELSERGHSHEDIDFDPLSPTPEANVLANYLTVPTSVAEDVMSSVMEDMVVFAPANDADVRSESSSSDGELFLEDVDESNVQMDDAVCARRSRTSLAARLFPEALGSFSVEQATVDVVGVEILDRTGRRCAPAASVCCKLHVGHWGDGRHLMTSPPWEITFQRKFFSDLLVPAQSKYFAFVLPSHDYEMPMGGFVYLGRQLNVLKVNRLLSTPNDSLITCGYHQRVEDAVAEELWAMALEAQASPDQTLLQGARFAPVRSSSFLKTGAQFCAFVGPKENFGGLSGSQLGGYVYLFDPAPGPDAGDGPPRSARFYPIVSAGVEFPDELTLFLEHHLLPPSGVTWQEDREFNEGTLSIQTPECSTSFATSHLHQLSGQESVKFFSQAFMPSEAAHYVFVFPPEQDPAPEALNYPYFLRGGFLYLTHSLDVCGAVAISFAPRSVKIGFRTSVIVKDAKVSGRLFEVTEPTLIQHGAEAFAYLGAGDAHENLNPRILGKTGGFFYMFREGRVGRFFPIDDVVQMEAPPVPRPQSLKREFPEGMRILFLERKTLDEQVLLEGHLKTSKDFEVTLALEHRRDALIPKMAVKFRYLYSSKDIGFPNGGFLYYDARSALVAANAICYRQTAHALSFGIVEEVGKEAVAALMQNEEMVANVEAPYFKHRGASRYCFLGPEEMIRDADDEVIFQAGPIGGLAFFFGDNPASVTCRFYPIASSGQVANRAKMTGDMNCAILPRDVKSEDLQSKRCGIFYDNAPFKRQVDAPVQVCRLMVPGVLHPVVLHSLAVTPRPQVLESRGARAIAEVAFGQRVAAVLLDLLCDVLGLGAIILVTEAVRGGGVLNGDNFPRFISALATMAVMCLKESLDELHLYRGYRRHGWTREFWAGHNWLVLGVITLCFVTCTWLVVALLTAVDEEALRLDDIRPLLALAGSMKWIRLLYMIRGFDTFKLGPRILPIFAALGEVKEFLLINVFFFGACFHASFALSDDDNKVSRFHNLLFTTYRLNFLADFDQYSDVLLLDNKGEAPAPWAAWQYFFFVVFSFVVSISLTNIFIGVMSNAFDFQSERVVELFVRSRSRIALEYSLREESRATCCHGCRRRPRPASAPSAGMSSEDIRGFQNRRGPRCRCARRRSRPRPSTKHHFLWLCFRAHEDVLQEGQGEGTTLRGHISGVGDAVLRKVDLFSDGFGRLESSLRRMQHRLNLLSKLVYAQSEPGGVDRLETDFTVGGGGRARATTIFRSEAVGSSKYRERYTTLDEEDYERVNPIRTMDLELRRRKLLEDQERERQEAEAQEEEALPRTLSGRASSGPGKARSAAGGRTRKTTKRQPAQSQDKGSPAQDRGASIQEEAKS